MWRTIAGVGPPGCPRPLPRPGRGPRTDLRALRERWSASDAPSRLLHECVDGSKDVAMAFGEGFPALSSGASTPAPTRDLLNASSVQHSERRRLRDRAGALRTQRSAGSRCVIDAAGARADGHPTHWCRDSTRARLERHVELSWPRMATRQAVRARLDFRGKTITVPSSSRVARAR